MSPSVLQMSWIQKYKPKTLAEVVGNEEAKNKILEWIQSWNKGVPKKRALFIYGPPGIGKTVSIEALANDLNLELIQSNASDYRTEDAVKRFAGRASEYATLFGKKRLILFDELDGITGSADRGGLREITEVAKNTRVPIILIANDAYDPRFATLRNHCLLIEFKKPTNLETVKHLKQICLREGIEAEEAALKFIAERSSGDVRSAVNDLQALAQGRKHLAYEDVSWLASRDRKEAIFNVLRNIFYAKDSLRAKEAVDMADVDPDMLYEWVYENLPYHVKNPKELVEAMDMLARADIYRGRVQSTQNWTLIRYFLDLMTAGIAASWSKRSSGWVPFKFPTRIGSLSRSKSEREMLTAIGMKIGKKCHISASKAVNEVLPYMRIIFQSSPKTADGLAKWLDLDKEMKDYIARKE
ncbi:MAG: replication factor C large subunit [Candidatus Bathyarchaeia archaeon]